MEIVEGINKAKKNFLGALNKNYIPPYIKIFRKIPYIGRCPAIVQVIIYGSILIIPGYLIATITNITEKLVDFWIYVEVAAAIIGVGLWALWYVYHKTLVVFEDVADMMTSKEQIAKLDSCLKLMYSSKFQLIATIGFLVITGLCILLLDFFDIFPEVTFPRCAKFYLGILIFLCLAVAGFGLWLAITSSVFIYQLTSKGKGYVICRLICKFLLGSSLSEKTIQEIGEIRFNPLFPARTVGITRLANLMVIYSILFAFEVSLFSIPSVLAYFNIGLGLPLMNPSLLPYKIIVRIILFLNFFVVPAYLVYPQLALMKMVIYKKNEVRRGIQMDIQYLHSNKKLFKSDDLIAIAKCIQIFKEVDSSPNMPIKVVPLIASILTAVGSIVSALIRILK